MGQDFYYNTIYVIESLGNSESNTAISLYETIRKFRYKHNGIKTYLESPSSSSDFFNILTNIKNNVSLQNVRPIIHIEAHGLSDGSGIKCLNGDLIKWNQLYPYFSEINIKIKNTLIITKGICFGAYFYLNLDPNKPAPFFTIISSVDKINKGEILSSYENFYNDLLFRENMNTAIRELNSQFLKPTNNELLLELYINDLITNYNNGLLESAKNEYKSMFIEKLISLWNKFLMIDLYPDTKNRYRNIKDILLEQIKLAELNNNIKISLKSEILSQLMDI